MGAHVVTLRRAQAASPPRTSKPGGGGPNLSGRAGGQFLQRSLPPALQIESCQNHHGADDQPERLSPPEARLEQSYGHKEKVDPSTLTIEHVLPQTLDEGQAGTPWKTC
jgi:hypothetical protein